MNNRIQELAKKAGLSYLYDYDADGHAMVCSESDIKKFAELIIVECMAQCDPQPGLKYSPNALSSRLDCKAKIQQLIKDTP